MRATFLGTGCAMVYRRYNTCFLLEDGENRLLVDAGGGGEILTRLHKLNIPIQSIGGIFVTHSHTDHILGVPWIIRAAAAAMDSGWGGTFTVAACPETLEHVRTICSFTLVPKLLNYFDKQILFRPVQDREQILLAGFHLTCFDICSTKMKQYGFLMKLPAGGVLCFPGDEPLKPEVMSLAQGARWLFSEAFCLYADRDHYRPYAKSHGTALDAGRMAAQLGAENLVIYHTVDYGDDREARMRDEAASVYGGGVFVPEDMTSLELNEVTP